MPGTPSEVGKIIDHTSTYQELLQFLHAGGVHDLAAFDSGIKSSLDLYNEIKKHRGSVRLTYNRELARIEREARSIRIRIYELKHQRLWLEVARGYWTGKIYCGPEDQKDYTAAETWIAGERDRATAIRCFWQEMAEHFRKIGYVPREEHLTPSSPQTLTDGVNDGVDSHKSKVWDIIHSIVTFKTYDLYLDLYHSGPSLAEIAKDNRLIVNKDYDGGLPDKKRGVTCYLMATHAKNPFSTTAGT